VLEADIDFMRLALREAKKGVGRTSPNPAVGAVVVRAGRVVGKGFHRRAGTPHAEVNALRAAGVMARGADLYVTLEPCNHTGRTPPCTQAVLQSGIKRVVVGMTDPNPGVTGKGCEYLAAQGLEVTAGILSDECRDINLPFIKYITTGLPWVIMKAGMSLDGRIAAVAGKSGWITNEQSRRCGHRLRDRVDAILVGAGTALIDDPSLTTRLPGRAGTLRGRDPLRVVLDTRLSLPPTAGMLRQNSAAETWIFCRPDPDDNKRRRLEDAGARIEPVNLAANGRLDLRSVLARLGAAQVTSLLVEGGGAVHGAFLQADLVDQAVLFVAPLFLGDAAVPVAGFSGVAETGGKRRLKIIRTRRLGGDIYIEGRFVL